MAGTCCTSSSSMCTEVRSMLATDCICCIYFATAAPFSSNFAKKLLILPVLVRVSKRLSYNTEFSVIINVHKDGSGTTGISDGRSIGLPITRTVSSQKIAHLLFTPSTTNKLQCFKTENNNPHKTWTVTGGLKAVVRWCRGSTLICT